MTTSPHQEPKKLIEREDIHSYRPMVERFARRVGLWDQDYIETLERLDYAGWTFQQICEAQQ